MLLRIFVLVFILVNAETMRAQQDLMLYSLPNVGQSIYVNPAHAPVGGIHIGLPFMSSISVQHSNSIFNPGLLFENLEGRVEFQTDYYLNKIRDKNSLGVDLATDIFSIGLPVKGHYFSFAIRDKVTAGITFPGDLLRFPFIGNGNFEVTDGLLDFSDLAINLNHYTEYGFGWQTTLKDRYYLGARTKLLLGKENITTGNNTLQWLTNVADYSWSFEGDMDVQTSGINNLLDSIDGNSLLENGKIGSYLLGGGNMGLAMDLGFGVQLNERLDIGLSVIDLGYIKWKKDNRNFSGQGSNIVFSGIEITEAFIQEGGSFSDSLQAALDDLGNNLEESLQINEDTDAYSSFLNTRIYGSVGYRLFKKKKSSGKANLLVHTELQNGIAFPSMSLSYVHTIADMLSLSLAYASIDRDFKNLGLAVSIKSGPTVFYCSMDNVLWLNMSKVRLDGGQGALTYPSYSKTASVHFGMNILLAKKNKSDSAAPRLD